jgi:hypothetical protein
MFSPMDSERMRQSRSTRLLLLACLVTIAGSMNAHVFGQGVGTTRTAPSRERTKSFIDDYSNSLQNEFDAPRKTKRVASELPDLDVKALQSQVRAFSDGMTQLSYVLNEEMTQVPGLRQCYTDALRLSGTAISINKHAEKHGPDRLLLDQLVQLDADWRDLNYRLDGFRSIPDQAPEVIKHISDADQKIRQLIGIAPQLNRRQLYLKAAGLVADIENLQEDLATELGNGEEAQVYRRSVGRLRQIVLNLITVIRDERSDASVIIEEYKQFETLWSPLVAKLRTEEDRYVERGLRRVSATAAEIHRMLLLPQKIDRPQFTFLAAALKKDIDEFFERTPLILVMHLPKSKQALAVAEQFYSACAQFSEVVNREQDHAQIVAAYRKIELAERAFVEVYRDVDSDKAVAVLNRISRSVSALRSSLTIQHEGFDSQAAEDLAASIQNFTEQIEANAKRWLAQDRQPFAANCLQDAADMSDRAAQLHDDIVKGKSLDQLKGEITELYDTWRRVYDYLAKCQTEDRQALGRVSANLTPAMVQLRTMILQ